MAYVTGVTPPDTLLCPLAQAYALDCDDGGGGGRGSEGGAEASASVGGSGDGDDDDGDDGDGDDGYDGSVDSDSSDDSDNGCVAKGNASSAAPSPSPRLSPSSWGTRNHTRVIYREIAFTVMSADRYLIATHIVSVRNCRPIT